MHKKETMATLDFNLLQELVWQYTHAQETVRKLGPSIQGMLAAWAETHPDPQRARQWLITQSQEGIGLHIPPELLPHGTEKGK